MGVTPPQLGAPTLGSHPPAANVGRVNRPVRTKSPAGKSIKGPKRRSSGEPQEYTNPDAAAVLTGTPAAVEQWVKQELRFRVMFIDSVLAPNTDAASLCGGKYVIAAPPAMVLTTAGRRKSILGATSVAQKAKMLAPPPSVQEAEDDDEDAGVRTDDTSALERQLKRRATGNRVSWVMAAEEQSVDLASLARKLRTRQITMDVLEDPDDPLTQPVGPDAPSVLDLVPVLRQPLGNDEGGPMGGGGRGRSSSVAS